MYITPAGEWVGREHPDPKTRVFDSRKEFVRFLFLYGEQLRGRISGLRRQVGFKLHGPNGTRICRYVADFVYILAGRRVVEDVKSPMTRRLRVYQIKRAWMLDEHGITIHET